jgi:hypothetical protein
LDKLRAQGAKGTAMQAKGANFPSSSISISLLRVTGHLAQAAREVFAVRPRQRSLGAVAGARAAAAPGAGRQLTYIIERHISGAEKENRRHVNRKVQLIW